MAIMKTLTINGTTYSLSAVVPSSSVTLLADKWVVDGKGHSQVVEIAGVTPKSKVNLQPTKEQLDEFHDKILAFVTKNDNGVVTIYSVGDKPTGDHTIQITLKEVEGAGPIWGNTVGTTMPRANLQQTDPTKADYVQGKEEFLADAGFVKTVNGKKPDENGNVEVEGGGGGSPGGGTDGKDGGYYIPQIKQEDQMRMRVSFTPSDADMPAVESAMIYLPEGPGGDPGENGVSPTVAVSAITGGHRITITDVKGTKNVDVMDGEDGSPGKDGTSVTVKSVSESTADGGSNVVTFSDGKTVTIKNGSKGSKGDKGDKGDSIKGDKGDTGKTAYQYAKEGGYTGTEAEFAQRMAHDIVAMSLTKVELSSLTTEEITSYYNDCVRAIFVEDGYTNLVPTAIGANGAIYYGCGYLNNYRLTSSGGLSLSDGSCVSGYVPYTNNAKFRVVGSRHLADAGGQYVAAYNADFSLISVAYISNLVSNGKATYASRADGVYELTMDTSKITEWKNAKYFRVSYSSCVGAELIITKDEVIGLEV